MQGLTDQGWIFMIAAWSSIAGLTVFCFSKVLRAKKKVASGGAGSGKRDRWASRIGLILAMAGNAIGLGNFLRFPVKAAANGGGAFMIPYFLALLFLGIPLMWVEWTMGRHGGVRGHGTTPGMFSLMWRHRAAKYVGTLGISIPLMIVVYYTFIESWTLAFSWFSATGQYFGNGDRQTMNEFLRGFQGVEQNSFFPNIAPLVVFLCLTLGLNYYFLYKGISKGIEMLAKFGMPILFIFAIVLVARVLTLGAPDPARPDMNVASGLAYIWNPDFTRLGQAEVWLVAAGQIFFTLSLGQGIIGTYASYLGKDDDVTLNGLSTSMTNEFAEVILGGTIAIPLAVAFFGLAGTQLIAKQGAFDLGFVSLPVIFQKIELGRLFGAIWFFLLFIAGITSSVAMTSPAVAFLEDEFKWSRTRSVNCVFALIIACTVAVVAFFKFGFLDELDYWAGTFGLVVFATVEIIIFAWIFGIDNAWESMHQGADLKVPRFFKPIIKYVTPLYMIALLVVWTYQEAIDKFIMKGEESSRHPYLLGARLLFAAVIVLCILLVRKAWSKKTANRQ